MKTEQIHSNNCSRGSLSRMPLRLGVWIALVMGVFGADLPQASAEVKYTVLDLGTLGGTNSSARGINESGQVTGTARTSGDAPHAFRWIPGGTKGVPSNLQMVDLGTLGGTESQGNGINESNQVAGYARLADNSTDHVFRWTPGGTKGVPSNLQMEDLGALGGTTTNSFGEGIDDGANVVGYVSFFIDVVLVTRAFTYSEAVPGRLQVFDPFGAGLRSRAYASQPYDIPQIVGSCEVPPFGPAHHAFLFTQGSPFLDLGTLGGVNSDAYGINNIGQVVGESLVLGSSSHAFRYDDDSGVMLDLGTLGGTNSAGYGINIFGQVVGKSQTTSNAATHAFLYSNPGPMQDLNGLIASNSGWVLTEARDINDNGQIVGTGTITGQQHAFLLTPINAVGISCEVQFFTNDVEVTDNICGSSGDVGVSAGTTVEVMVKICADAGNPGSVFHIAYDITLDGAAFAHCENIGSMAPGACRAACDSGSIPASSDNTPDTHAFAVTVSGTTNAGGSASSVTASCIRTLERCPGEVKVAALEVVQVIQDWHNSVPLIAGKTTYVRAHFQSANEEMVTGKLRGFIPGAFEFPDSPLSPINGLGYTVTTINSPSRRLLDRSLNFELPESWTAAGNIELQLEPTNAVPPTFRIVCREPAEQGGTSGDCKVQVTFTDTAPLSLKLFQTRALDGVESSLADLVEVALRVKAIFPINTVEYADGQIDFNFDNSGVMDNPRTQRELALLNADLETRRHLDGCFSVFGCNRLYVAVLRGLGRGGQANGVPGTVCSGTLLDGYTGNRYTLPHEIGHCLGREHAASFSRYGFGPCEFIEGASGVRGACGECVFTNLFLPLESVPEFPHFFSIGGSDKATLGPTNDQDAIFGLDTQKRNQLRVMDPKSQFELMSYCKEGNTRWISKYTYEAILDAINSTFSGARAPQRLGAAAIQEYLLVRGMIHLDSDVAEFLPFVSYSSDVVPPAPAAGEYQLQLLNALGDVVTHVSFQPSPGTAEFAPPLGTFLIAVPADPAIRQAVVRHNEALVITRAASAHAPTIQMTFPNGGENLADDPVVLSWDAADADGDPLTYVVQYSADGGVTFETLAVDWPQKTFSLSHRFFKGNNNALIRVTASDGFNTATDDSDAPFIVGNNRPAVSLLAPSEGEMFFGDTPVFFEAFALDSEDGELTGLSLQWSSDLDGALGTGTEVNVPANQLSEGTHLITVIATDSGALTSTASVHVVVAQQVPATLADLVVTKEAATDNVAVGTDLSYTVTVNNQGPSAATGVMLTDTLPPNVGLVSVLSSKGNCTPSGSTILCNLGNLASGSNVSVTVVLHPTVEGVLTNTVTVVGNGPDPVPANNTAKAITFVGPPPPVPHDLAVLSVKPPKKIALSEKKPSQIKGVKISVGSPGTELEFAL